MFLLPVTRVLGCVTENEMFVESSFAPIQLGCKPLLLNKTMLNETMSSAVWWESGVQRQQPAEMPLIIATGGDELGYVRELVSQFFSESRTCTMSLFRSSHYSLQMSFISMCVALLILGSFARISIALTRLWVSSDQGCYLTRALSCGHQLVTLEAVLALLAGTWSCQLWGSTPYIETGSGAGLASGRQWTDLAPASPAHQTYYSVG